MLCGFIDYTQLVQVCKRPGRLRARCLHVWLISSHMYLTETLSVMLCGFLNYTQLVQVCERPGRLRALCLHAWLLSSHMYLTETLLSHAVWSHRLHMACAGVRASWTHVSKM